MGNFNSNWVFQSTGANPNDLANIVTGSTFSTLTGDLILSTLSGDTITENLDGRYTLLQHNHVISDITDFPTNVSFFNNDVGYITGFTDTTYTTGSGLILNGTELSHSDTSNQINTSNSSTEFIQNIELDAFGHITKIFSSSESDPTVPTHVKNITTGDTTNWDVAYGDKINAITVTGDANKIITLTQQDGTTLTANFQDIDTTNIDIKINTLNFNNANGVLTATRDDGIEVTTDLDGRYSLLEHTHVIADITDFPTNLGFFNNDVGYITGFTDTNTFVTGFTYNNSNVISIDQNNNKADLSVNIGIMSGLTVNGIISSENIESTTVSATTYLNLPEDNNDYVNEVTFSASTGNLTLTTLSGNTVIENLDGRYSLTNHIHDINEISGFTNNSADWDTAFLDSTTGVTVTGDINKTLTLFQRDGSVLTAKFIDSGTQGSGDVVTGVTFNTSSGELALKTLSGSTVTENLDGRYLLTDDYQPGDSDTNDYVTGATFNSDTGELTLNRLSGTTFSTNLDNRYFLSGPEIFEIETINNVTYVGYGELNACKIRKVTTISGATYTAFWSESEETLNKEWSNRLNYSYF